MVSSDYKITCHAFKHALRGVLALSSRQAPALVPVFEVYCQSLMVLPASLTQDQRSEFLEPQAERLILPDKRYQINFERPKYILMIIQQRLIHCNCLHANIFITLFITAWFQNGSKDFCIQTIMYGKKCINAHFLQYKLYMFV